MKLPHLLAAAALVLGAGCNSLDNPLTHLDLFKTGHDGRVFNSRTGEYEWPARPTPRPRTKAAPASRTAAATPAPSADGRGYDPQKGEFAEPNPARGAR